MAATVCTASDPSYLYWNSSGSTSPVSIKNNQASPSTEWIGYGTAYDYSTIMSLTDQSHAANSITLNQIPNPPQPYAGYVRYGDPVTLEWGSNHLGMQAGSIAWVGDGNCAGGASPPDFSIFQSSTKSTGDPILYGDTLALQPAALCSTTYAGSPSGSPATSPAGQVPWQKNSPQYMYEIQDNTFATPLQTEFACYGTDCICAPDLSGPVSFSSCEASCGQSGSPLPGSSNTYRPFSGVASLPLAGCSGVSAGHTYTLYSGSVENLWLMFILGETPDSVSTTVPVRVKDPNYPSSNGFVLFSFNGTDGSATVVDPAPRTTPDVNWKPNSKWQSWAVGGAPKIISVKISMNGLSITMNGSTQTLSFIDLGYASGLYCNLYTAQGVASYDPKLAVQGTAHLLEPVRAAKPLAPNWWWYGLVLTGVVAIVMIWLVAWVGR